MNKQELIDAVIASTGKSKASTGETIDGIFDTVMPAVTEMDAVQLNGFGTVPMDARAACVGQILPLVLKSRFPPQRLSSSQPGKRLKTR